NGSIVIGLMLMFFAGSPITILRNVSHYWFLIVPPACALGLYCLVGWMEGRYIAPFVILVILGLFFATGLQQRDGSIVRAVAAVILVMFAIEVVPRLYSAVIKLAQRDDQNEYWQVADGLREMGLRPGDRVASTSYANVNNVQWARLAKVRIVAEVYHNSYDNGDKNDFWTADLFAQQRILEAFANLGTRMVVSDEKPHGRWTSGWQRVGTTSYYAYRNPSVHSGPAT